MKKKLINPDKKLRAYIIGLTLGDGNLSNPNGRGVRLRISSDKKYPLLIEYIEKALQKLLPENRVSIVNRKNSVDVSCYSNYWPEVLGWNAGAKFDQKVTIPLWIKENRNYTTECLRGLIQTDGSIYHDRDYPMVNFTSYIPTLANDTFQLIKSLSYNPNMQRRSENSKTKHTIRISKDTKKFIKEVKLWKR